MPALMPSPAWDIWAGEDEAVDDGIEGKALPRPDRRRPRADAPVDRADSRAGAGSPGHARGDLRGGAALRGRARIRRHPARPAHARDWRVRPAQADPVG